MVSPGFDIPEYFREQVEDKPVKPSLFDIFAKLLLPIVLALVAVYRRESTAALLGFAAVALLASFYRHIVEVVKHCANHLHDRTVARKAIKSFRSFCREFSFYFDASTSRSDTLAGILSEFARRNPQGNQLNVALRIPPVELFHSHMHWLNVRISKERLSASELHELINEFTNLVGSYASFCVYPVFRIFASELREALMPNERSQLNGFQGRFVVSVTGYQKFLKDLNDEFRLLSELPIGIMLPDPL
jgi:hypothetical protein